MKGKRISYSAEELAWIEARKKMPRRQAHALFCATWSRDDVSLSNYNALCKRKGWMTGRTGQFPKGLAPHNKGKPMPDDLRQKCLRTAFKKGNLPHNHRGHGHERIDSKDGYVVMIVAEKNPWTGADTRPVHKHRYLWEQRYGPVPKGHVLKCLDGDKTNCDPDNWELIPRALLPRLSGRWTGVKYDEAPAELKPAVMAVAKLDHKAREIRRGRKTATAPTCPDRRMQ
ncbi:HNH endonuclease signature motif containing protein [Paracoccus seriniphilus]|uniref:HNH endonuclease n=1 Tax=Paracoccus seriniphilus TaxID=184748 RepID=A0A239Q1R6_9RHOB|nr:HNH endonuclease signature motif containing protein [Paracoccus seriniphilus]WCR13243.1 HNH endonuclease [Paracoccus seriniphilus]SNT76444.1 HNH endonuclease [Paracoccus seriniphilus]